MQALTDVEMRFWSKVAIGDGCWLWTAQIVDDGYGAFWFRGKKRRAHVVSWVLAGRVVPDGHGVLHDCPDGDNPACVRPSHLWTGTQAENIADRDAKGRTSRGDEHYSRRQPERLARGDKSGRATHPESIPYGMKTNFAKLDDDAVREIRRRADTGESKRSIADSFNVTPANVYLIVARETWRHI